MMISFTVDFDRKPRLKENTKRETGILNSIDELFVKVRRSDRERSVDCERKRDRWKYRTRFDKRKSSATAAMKAKRKTGQVHAESFNTRALLLCMMEFGYLYGGRWDVSHNGAVPLVEITFFSRVSFSGSDKASRKIELGWLGSRGVILARWIVDIVR